MPKRLRLVATGSVLGAVERAGTNIRTQFLHVRFVRADAELDARLTVQANETPQLG